MTPPEPPANARFFQFPSSYRWLVTGSLPVFCVLVVVGFFFLLFNPGPKSLAIGAICVIEFGFFALLAIRAVHLARDRVAVNDDGLWYLTRRDLSTFIRWDEVANVEAHEIRKRLVITDMTGQKRINLEYQLDGFETLRNFVLERTTARRRQTFAPSVFHGGYLKLGFLLFAFLMWIAFVTMSIRSGQPLAAAGFVGLALLTLYGIVREPRTLTISSLSIIVGYPGWHRSIPFDSVTNVEIDNTPGNEQGYISAAVFVETVNGRPLKLIGFREGSVALYDALCAGWAAARGVSHTSIACAAPSPAFGSEPAASPAATTSALPRVFHAGMHTWLVLVGPVVAYSAVIFADQLYRSGDYFGDRRALIIGWCVLFAVYLFIALLRVPRRIRLSSQVLEVQYTLWRRAVPYGAIAEIELSTGRDLRNKRTHTVRVHLRKGGSLRLGGVREGTAELYQVLRAAWQAASSLAAQQSTAADASPADVSAHVPPSNELSQTTQLWFVPAMVATAALVAVIAMPGTWRRLPLMGGPAPDWKALERFPQMRTGWKGTPRPLFSGDVRYHRWNLDYATGVFSHNQTDFYIGDSIPLNLTRVYLNRFESQAFGAGMSASCDILLLGDSVRFTYLDLIMPNGQQFHFKRISPGDSWAGSVFRSDPASNQALKSAFLGATLWWNGNGWSLRLTDGTLMKFPAVHGNIRVVRGALLSIEDAHGNAFVIRRDHEGNILEIVSPHGASVVLTHDMKNRISKAIDSFGNTVSYSYDDFDRLVAVSDSREGTTRYAYDEGNNLVRVTKPDGADWLRIEYDSQARVVKVTFEDGSSCRYAYKTDSQGAVVAVDLFPSNGPPRQVSVRPTASQNGLSAR
jgi:YD repeat-containing protein